jgi:glycosyltransferase involved in cell wall biosynthesis
VIHNGIDLQQYNPDIDPDKIRKELNLNHQDPLIGCIGRMGCKGQREILYALKNVISEFPRIRCLFVSEFSDPEPLYEDLNKLGLLGHVIFKGFRNDVPHIISSMDVLINFPTWEALGMIIIEAMACAKPVIGSDVGGIPEILKDRVNGILVPPGDTEKLSQAIIYLLKNKQDALNIGKSGRDLVEKNFNLEDTIEKKEKLYYKFL